MYSHPLVSVENCFQNSSQMMKSIGTQVSCEMEKYLTQAFCILPDTSIMSSLVITPARV